MDGGLKARASDNGALLSNADGTQHLRYHKLQVLDAAGRSLDAQLRVTAANQVLIAFDDRQARYPVAVDPLLVNEEAKLTVTGDDSFFGSFGDSVALDADTMVVGRPERGSAGQGVEAGHGSAYVFVRSGSTWVQQAKLRANDGATSDLFGNSVALSGNTVLVGAPGDDIGANSDQG